MPSFISRRIQFYTQFGLPLAGDLYLPEPMPAGDRVPGIVLCQGYTGLRNLLLPGIAQRLAQKGLAALIFDYRGFGDSGGPRERLYPENLVRDVRNGLSFLSQQPEIESSQLGLYGVSFGGAVAAYAAALDRRVKAVVSVSAFADGEELIRANYPPEEFRKLLDRASRALNHQATVGVEAHFHPLEIMSFEPGAEKVYEEFVKKMPQLQTRMAFDTLDSILNFKPIDVVHRIAPRAYLIIHAEKDRKTSLEQAKALARKAGEPCQLAVFPDCDHPDLDRGHGMEEQVRLAGEWFKSHF
ncbi:MAG: alpha/beta fold hydrolase [Verrucomicrobiae bacterium]|nr:alpha/beta fold hydrolase [Verrucomicrobiae bacterium]